MASDSDSEDDRVMRAMRAAVAEAESSLALPEPRKLVKGAPGAAQGAASGSRKRSRPSLRPDKEHEQEWSWAAENRREMEEFRRHATRKLHAYLDSAVAVAAGCWSTGAAEAGQEDTAADGQQPTGAPLARLLYSKPLRRSLKAAAAERRAARPAKSTKAGKAARRRHTGAAATEEEEQARLQSAAVSGRSGFGQPLNIVIPPSSDEGEQPPEDDEEGREEQKKGEDRTGSVAVASEAASDGHGGSKSKGKRVKKRRKKDKGR